jgi:arsenate reductase
VEKPGVLFLCTANSARSLMAEAFFRRASGDRFEVASAGLNPRPVHPLAVRVMREEGIDLSAHEPRAVKEFLGRAAFRYVVIVCRAVEPDCPTVWPFSVGLLHRPFDDPTAGNGTEEERLDRFRAVRDEIAAFVYELATGAKEKGITAGIAVGAVIGLEAMFAGPVCGASMNPVRSLAPAVVSGHTEHLWAYLIAPTAGALLAVIVAYLVREPRVANFQGEKAE